MYQQRGARNRTKYVLGEVDVHRSRKARKCD